MSESQYSEIVSEKIRSFITAPENREELTKVLSAIRKKYRIKFGCYFDKDRHSEIEIFLDCLDKIKSGKRLWNHRNIKLQPMLINTARSMIGSELKKEIQNRNKTELCFEKILTSDGEEYPTEEELLDYLNTDRDNYKSELNTFYDKEIIIMTQKILKHDTTALKVMNELKEIDSNIEISRKLKITVRDVENARKRIRRAGKKVLLKISEQLNLTKEEIRNEILRRE